MAIGITFVRFRCSPWYPHNNDVNSDIFVYQLVGNSWAHGLLPYRDVYDVKGPFLYLLFRVFALLRPWSMAPPVALLALLAFCSLSLAFASARRCLPQPLAVLVAIASCAVIYLSVAGVPTSFTCEELAVPGVLLLLWLVSRWLDGAAIADAWWFLDGAVFGALFWSKYQVIAPWGAVFAAVAVSVLIGRRSARSLHRVVALHLGGVVVVTAIILSCYAPVLSELFRAYFWAKAGAVGGTGEFRSEAAFIATTVRLNTAVTLALMSVLALLVVAACGAGRHRWVLPVAFCLSLWASVALVRHPNNFFVPLSFCAIVLPQVVRAVWARSRAATWAVSAGVLALVVTACTGPLDQAVQTYGLLRQPPSLTCYRLPSSARTTTPRQVSTFFADSAGHRPILSLGKLLAAKSSYISQLLMTRPFEFVDASWSRNIGADGVQARYLQDRTFAFVWVHVDGLNPFRDVPAQAAAATYQDGPSRLGQAAALTRNYSPVLACGNDVLLRAR